ncbi:transcription factor bHLH140 isoform X2 [Selaginella moellendorffii]|uniref:transcription factor bHLH140 isoform X2 n=1 Tax=Selaginella moellendorffii TaxID=88036 RepID=UPI000D1D05FD|nr:transcription factor bHLH140 isoform X2 [Selaginella moellendorffii]|eukprot:XP_024536868.1 transcription factor bHLH140 isoform X2 [Selaginella moellendorffii]
MESSPVCKYGAACYRKNPEHWQQFSHPPSPSSDKAFADQSQEQAPAIIEGSASCEPNLVVVVLVGVPGSGKSRFCSSVIENASQTWTRICQDIIANGKRGTKAQCIKQATIALNSSSSVFIDRTNLNREQRLEFIEFAKKRGVEAHAVVLNLPVGTCITRAMNRTSHEGGLEGKKVGAVIQRMAHGVELPALEEGFSRITVCRTDGDADECIVAYRSLSSSSKLPTGVFDRNSSSTTKGSLEQFLNKPGGGQKKAGQASSSAASTKKGVESAAPELKDGDGSMPQASEESCATLAFPSISTADFRFDHEKAANIIVETVSEFFSRAESSGLRLVLVDIDQGSDMLSRVRSKAESAGLDSRKFLVTHGDITKLHSTGGPRCSVIANAANWRLKGGGGGVNLAIYRAAGDDFEEATKKYAKTLDPGKVVAVPLPASSPLRTKEGVTHVIHVLGPNMNPQRPNCIADDYSQGCRLLRQCYAALFSTFASIAKGQASKAKVTASPASNSSSPGGKPRDAFAVMMQASKRKNVTGEEGNPASGTGTLKAAVEEKAATKKPVNWPAWAQALHDVAFHPEKHSNVVLEVTDDCVVLPDLYAKAKKHLLVVSRKAGLDSIADVTNEHLPLLREMHAVGERWAKKLVEEDNTLVFRLGYHSVPSMRQVHLHVISQDFNSPGLKNKKHWNSFTTSFFRDSRDVIAELESRGKLEECTEEMEKRLLDSELRCHRCRCVQPNIPRLKAHVCSCSKPLPLQSLIS